MPPRKAVASTMAGVSSVLGPVYRLPVAVGRLRGDEAHVRRQVDEIAAEQLEIGMDRADLDAPLADQLRKTRPLRSREREVETLRDAALEHVDVLGQREHRLHEMQVVHLRGVDADQALAPGSPPASGCCLRGRRGRRARSPFRAARWRSPPQRAFRGRAAPRARFAPRDCARCGPTGVRVDGCTVILSRRSRRSPSRPLPTSPSPF